MAELYERTLLVIGLGSIGERVAQVESALGMQAIGVRPRYNERAMPIFLDNLKRYRDGIQLRNLVDKAGGY